MESGRSQDRFLEDLQEFRRRAACYYEYRAMEVTFSGHDCLSHAKLSHTFIYKKIEVSKENTLS